MPKLILDVLFYIIIAFQKNFALLSKRSSANFSISVSVSLNLQNTFA